ncbi:MAG TPA: 50S ribosomal protein L33 [Candidatus Moranbacteria bacterium]|nr:50S ribosomal protein L33 [Candidatus Moranbacteria bacterium]
MAKTKENLVKFKCNECKKITHYSNRNKKKLKEKLEMKKYCKFCKKHTLHKEAK